MTRKMSQSQQNRQKHRATSGRYDLVNPCNLCGKSAGVVYFSDRRLDTIDSCGHDWGGLGLCLCAKCCTKLDGMDDSEAYGLLMSKR
jgi:hypothetical protein